MLTLGWVHFETMVKVCTALKSLLFPQARDDRWSYDPSRAASARASPPQRAR